jgi:hypothetical protein
MPDSMFWQERCEGRPRILDNAGTFTRNSEKYKHTNSSIWFIEKSEGREGEFTLIFLTGKFHQSYPNQGRYEKEAYITRV